MIYKCGKCHYLFSSEKELTDKKDDRYRCPDCGKFAVRIATEAERKEYTIQLQIEDPWLEKDPSERGVLTNEKTVQRSQIAKADEGH